jgi:hypothetical protein
VKAILSWIAKSPRLRLAATIIGTVAVGIFCNVYANQIAPKGVIAWSKLHRVSSFWPLVIVIVVWLAINLGFFRHDQAVERFADDEFCLAFVRSTNLEAYAKQVKNDPTKTRDAREVLREIMVKKK